MVGFGHVPDGGFISSSGIGFGSDDLTGLAGADLSILEYYATTFGNYGADYNLLTDWWVYDPVDGHITGPNLTKADGGFASDSFGFDHDFNVTAADLASYYDDLMTSEELTRKWPKRGGCATLCANFLIRTLIRLEARSSRPMAALVVTTALI